MAGPRESAVENPVVVTAEREGFFVRKVKWIGKTGAPDRVFSREDRGTVWLELKRPIGGSLQYNQVLEIRRMRAAGMEVHVPSTYDEAMAILRAGGPVPMKPV